MEKVNPLLSFLMITVSKKNLSSKISIISLTLVKFPTSSMQKKELNAVT